MLLPRASTHSGAHVPAAAAPSSRAPPGPQLLLLLIAAAAVGILGIIGRSSRCGSAQLELAPNHTARLPGPLLGSMHSWRHAESIFPNSTRLWDQSLLDLGIAHIGSLHAGAAFFAKRKAGHRVVGLGIGSSLVHSWVSTGAYRVARGQRC